MAADSQVVDMEGLVRIDIVVHAGLDHVLIPLGPEEFAAVCHLQALEVAELPPPGGSLPPAELMPVVAQIGVGLIPAIHVAVGVVALDQIALPAQLLGQGEIAVGLLLSCLGHGDGEVALGIQAQQVLTLAVRGAGKVERGVEIVEHKALMGQLVEGRGQLLADPIA